MIAVENYLGCLPEEQKVKIREVVEYIRQKYPNMTESCDYAPKTKFPVFKHPDAHNYVGIASQKAYIAIHFGRYHCVSIVADADSRIMTGVGCAKIPDGVTFPAENIKRAIDACFES
ncbi:hypothetical protein FACS1894184_19050 [Clostridia bacterium]|nr:hypothetical protein FACS1894184_19050 [Clostridia bacterium]